MSPATAFAMKADASSAAFAVQASEMAALTKITSQTAPVPDDHRDNHHDNHRNIDRKDYRYFHRKDHRDIHKQYQ